MKQKFELRVFYEDGKGPDVSILGEVRAIDIRSDYEEDPNPDFAGYPRWRLARRWVEFEGDLREWKWNQGKPTWVEDIPEGAPPEADPMCLHGGVRPGAGGPEDQEGVARDAAVGGPTQDVEGPVLPQGEPDRIP